mgnify:CR=1 FL=1
MMIDKNRLTDLPKILEERKAMIRSEYPDVSSSTRVWKRSLTDIRERILFFFEGNKDQVKYYMIAMDGLGPAKGNIPHVFDADKRKQFLKTCEGVLAMRDGFIDFMVLLTVMQEILSAHPDPLVFTNRDHLKKVQKTSDSIKKLDRHRKGDQIFIEKLRELLAEEA